MAGGNLRREFAAGLTEAAALLDEPGLGHEALRWVEIAELWHTLAETAAPTSVAACAQARELTTAVTGAVMEGDAGRTDRAAAAGELWALRDRYAAEPPFGPDDLTAILAGMSGIRRGDLRGPDGRPSSGSTLCCGQDRPPSALAFRVRCLLGVTRHTGLGGIVADRPSIE